jgi:hypothetical protein
MEIHLIAPFLNIFSPFVSTIKKNLDTKFHNLRNKNSKSSQRIICACNKLLVMDIGCKKDGRILEVGTHENGD